MEVRTLLSTQGLAAVAIAAASVAPANGDFGTPVAVLVAQSQPDSTGQAAAPTEQAQAAAVGIPSLALNPNVDLGPFVIPARQPSVSYGPPDGSLTYPAQFDLRTSGDVTSVKDQGQCGSCWTFATYASLESAILKAGGPTTDFSENNLKNYNGFDSGPCDGGTILKSQAYLTRWDGPVSETDDPYHA